MMKSRYNICIFRPPNYQWSSVFQELAELLAFSIEDLKFSARIEENQVFSDNINIVFGAHLLNQAAADMLPADTIIFNTEQLGALSSRWVDNITYCIRKFTTWDYSTQNIQYARENLGVTPHFFKIGHHPRLARIPKSTHQPIDVLFYGIVNESRARILYGLKKTGLNVVSLHGKFGQERDEYISQSKIVLNLHQHNSKILETVRLHYLMSNSKAIVSQFDENTIADPDYLNGLILSKYEDIVERCHQILKRPDQIDHHESQALKTISQIDAVQIMAELLKNND